MPQEGFRTGELPQEEFREIMSRFPAGVTVVTAYDGAGFPRGLTVSAFCSVSLSPPLVLVCLDRGSDTLAAIRERGAYTVNFLSADGEDMALRFASKGDGKFEGVSHRPPGSDGGPVLEEGSAAYVVCRVWRTIEAGDHWVLLGRVQGGARRDGEHTLVYGERRFAGWHELLERASSW
ncbi:MAG: flavin reductase family protein [Rubrobacteraceae bacterium]|uniref:flavin reductase family protein n=1 Tax=Rubrobacter calidifluminis TaxID=1392640 RepID=UPI0023603F83|nr:flavin reductase family protein [Rubrobacter calidifluminis]MBX6764920.1 flavin reductase family protein [Rubrobacteraceae bacterium]